MKVLSVDPGGTSKSVRGGNPQGTDGATGAVLFEPISQLEIKVLEWRETVERMEFLNWAWNLKTQQDVAYCICEAYKPAAFVKTYQPDVIYIIGTLEWMWTPDLFYNKTFAVTANAWGTDTKLRPYREGEDAVGRGGHGHALMALRHALHWTANHWKGMER
jgi:hypothetical protein